jgi:hypothetical protein
MAGLEFSYTQRDSLNLEITMSALLRGSWVLRDDNGTLEYMFSLKHEE